MTVPQRLLAVPALAGVLYLSVILAGLSGFDPSIWALYTALFLVWHILMHVQGPALPVVIMVHGVVAAAFLGLGALVGQWTGLAPSPFGALALGAGATALARLVRISPEQAAEIAALAEEAAAKLEAARPATEPEPEPTPEPDPEPAPDDLIEHDLAALHTRLEALPQDTINQHDLVTAITPAIGPVPLRELVSALFARARANPSPRDLRAVTVLLTDPHVAHQTLGHADPEAAFHLIRAAGDGAAMAHWAMQTEAVLDLVPGLGPDLPEATELADAAAAFPEAADVLHALANRQPDAPDESAAQ